MGVQKDDKQLFYKEYGSGETLCLLHGFLENLEMWNGMLESLSQKYRVILIDLPGHGKSPLLAQDNGMKAMAHAVNDILETLNVETVKLVGHSMGGYVALAFAEAFPQKTKGLLLLNSTPEADTAERKKMRNHAIDMAGRNYEALVSMSVANLFSAKRSSEFEQEIKQTKTEALKVTPEAYITCQRAMRERLDYSNLWKTADLKKQMILGSDDGLIDAEKMKHKFIEAEVKIDVLTGGHMLHIENFREVAGLIANF
ncbi:MAG: alpha/beta hydrolase [Leeuwenhoekiella sp.]|nr:MAG: alpha/beta hydrolase [Leeuwenhoekiella sp.]